MCEKSSRVNQSEARWQGSGSFGDFRHFSNAISGLQHIVVDPSVLRILCKMLDLFTIFSKGGIVLWCFQGTSQSFTNSVNSLIKSVILQVCVHSTCVPTT